MMGSRFCFCAIGPVEERSVASSIWTRITGFESLNWDGECAYLLKMAGGVSVVVSPPKVVGQKAVVQLAMKNEFEEVMKSARAAMFLLDEQGKMIGQGSQWVIGGGK